MDLSEVLRELRKDLPLGVASRETQAEDASLTYGLDAIHAALEAQERGDEGSYYFHMRDAFSVAREWNNKSALAGRVVKFYSLAKKRRAGSSTGTRRQRRRGLLVLGSLAVVSVGLFVVAPLSISAYDDAHRFSVTCTVTSAQAASGGTRSLRGVGSSTPQVDVETDECGSLLLRDGVTGDNVGDIAEELDSADRYVFTVGDGSYALRGILGTVGIATEMHDFRRSP